MSTYDPRVVAQALDDLQGQLSRWSVIASDTLANAIESQRHAKEAVERALHQAAIILDRAQIDDESVKKTLSSAAAAVDKCNMAKSAAHQTLTQSKDVLQSATATLQKWEAELAKALAWLARAEARLANAIREHESAVQALSEAKYELSRAESRLRDCQNDQNRKNCRSEAAAVTTAQADVRTAQARVKITEQEVIAAREEVEQAKARVACCQKAVATAKQAVSVAKEGVASAENAVNAAERSVEYTQAAERLAHVAQEKAAMEMESAENMMTDVRAALSLTDEAALHLRTADQAEDTAQLYSTNGRKELAYREQLLRDLNRPPFDSGVQVKITKSGEGTHGYPYQKARKEFMRTSLSDSDIAKHIKGWIQQEINRVGKSRYWRSPPGYDVGHKTAGIDQPENFHWENSGMNRSKGAKFKR